MDQRSERYADALRAAAQLLGSQSRLAGFLGVPDEELARWMAGVEAAPLWAFVQTLDLIGDMPHAAKRTPGVQNERRGKRVGR